jgi:hypothetical protein
MAEVKQQLTQGLPPQNSRAKTPVVVALDSSPEADRHNQLLNQLSEISSDSDREVVITKPKKDTTKSAQEKAPASDDTTIIVK